MSSVFYDKWDKFLYPFEIQDADSVDGQKHFVDDGFSGNAIVVDEGGGNVIVEVEVSANLPKTYWYHNDNSSQVSDYPQFVQDLEDQLNANGSLSNTYTLSANTPTNSDITNSGLRISADGSFTIRFTSPDFTMDPRLLGFPMYYNTDTASDGSDNVDSPASYFGAWFAPVVADDHRREPYSIQADSDSSTDRYSIRWDANSRRRNEYFDVKGAHVFRNRADIASEATRAGLPQEDNNNALEDLWRQSNVLRSGIDSDILVVYNNTNPQLSATGTDWEIVRLVDNRQRTEFFRSVINDIRNSKGETYEVTFTTEIIETFWLH